MRKRKKQKQSKILPKVGRSFDQDRSVAISNLKGDYMNNIVDNIITLKDTCEISQRVYEGLQYDYLVPINELKENKFNHKLYKNWKNKKNQEYIVRLAQQIDEQGLQRTPIIFADELLLIGGHHRKRALELLGVSHIPVRKNDKNYTWKEFKNKPLSIMIFMASDNQRPEESEYDYWCALMALIEAHKVQNGSEPTKKDIQSFGATAGFSYNKWLKYKTLINGGTYRHPKTKQIVNLPPRPELWNDVVKGDKNVDWCCRTQKNDAARDDGIILPKLPEHDNLVDSEMCSEMMRGMGRYVKDVMNTPSEVYGEIMYPMRWADKSVISGFCSSFIEGCITKGLKAVKDITAVKNNKGGHYDVSCESQPNTFNKPFKLEVKHTFENYWSSGTEKIGYNLLCKTNSTYDKFCVICVYVPEFTWSLGGHGPKKLSLNSLKDLDYKVLHGDLVENKKGNMEIILQEVK